MYLTCTMRYANRWRGFRTNNSNVCVCVCLCVCVTLSVHVIAFPTPLPATITIVFIPFRLYGLHHCVQNIILL